MATKNKLLYPERINNVRMPEELKNFLLDYADEKEKPENLIIREWIEELQTGKIDLDELKKYCY